MEAHVGQFIIIVIQIVSAVWSEVRKGLSEKRINQKTEKTAEELRQEQDKKAEEVALMQRLIAEEMKRNIEELRDLLQHNTSLTEKAVEVSTQAHKEANNFNQKWQVLAEADAERVLAGRLAELIGAGESAKGTVLLQDIRDLDKDTNVRLKNVEKTVNETASVLGKPEEDQQDIQTVGKKPDAS